MSEMQRIMESWRKYSAQGNVPLPDIQQVNDSKVFLFEGKTRHPTSTRTFGSLFEDLEKNKISLTNALEMWKRSSIYEMKIATSSSDKQILEEIFGFGKEKDQEEGEESEENTTKSPEKKKKSLKRRAAVKAIKYGNIAIAHILVKGYRFFVYLQGKLGKVGTWVITNLFGENPDSSAIYRAIRTAASIFMEIVKKITGFMGWLWKKYSALMSNPVCKLIIIALCVALCTLSLWFPILIVVVPYALKKIAWKTGSLAISAALKLIVKKIRQKAKDKRVARDIKQHAAGFDAAMKKAQETGEIEELMPILKKLGMEEEIALLQKAIKQDQKAMAAEGKNRKLDEVDAGEISPEDVEAIKEISKQIGVAIMVLVEEVGESHAEFTVTTDGEQWTALYDIVDSDETGEATSAWEEITSTMDGDSEVYTKEATDAIISLQNYDELVKQSKSAEEAMEHINELIEKSADGQQGAELVAKQALQMAGKLCEWDPMNWCGGQKILADGIKVITKNQIYSEIKNLGTEAVAGLEGLQHLETFGIDIYDNSLAGNINPDLDVAGAAQKAYDWGTKAAIPVDDFAMGGK